MNSGQLALQRAGLFAKFRAVARYEDQGTRLYDKSGQLLFAHSDPAATDRPEIDRAELRRLLLESLAVRLVRWGCKLERVLPRADGTYTLVLDSGAHEDFDLVVGADGAWSKVRPLISAAQPAHSGVTLVELDIEDVDRRHPHISAMVGRGTMMALGDCKALLAQRNGGGVVRVYAAQRMDAAKQEEIDQSAQNARAFVLNAFARWAPDLLELVHQSDSLTVRPLYALPIGHRWSNRAGVTLIGDAAHLMTPFSGEGVNSAMLDAAELGHCLIENADWKAAVRDYEASMFARAAAAAAKAQQRLDMRFAPNALGITRDALRAHFG